MPHSPIPRRTFLWLPAAAAADAGITARATVAVRRHLDLLLDASGRAVDIKGKDAAALISMCFEILHASTGEARYRRAAVELAGRVLAAMRASPPACSRSRRKKGAGEVSRRRPASAGLVCRVRSLGAAPRRRREADLEYVAR